MFDFRYHIVSLVAVFLALGIGILVGTMVAEKGVITTQERGVIDRLEKDFDKLRGENRTLTDQVKVYERFQGAASPYLVDGKLLTRNVAIVVTTNLDADSHKSLVDTLQLAGAKVVSTTTLRVDSALEKKENAEKIGQLVGASPANAGDLKGKLISEFARQLATAQNPKFISDLASFGAVRTDGSYDQPISTVVVVGGLGEGKKSTAADTDVPLIKVLLSLNTAVVGTETSQTDVSYIPDYQKAGVSTIDNIDSLTGQIALVYVLQGRDGNYGIKASAQQIMPAFKK